jgi:hypothetical protein
MATGVPNVAAPKLDEIKKIATQLWKNARKKVVIRT